MARYTPDGSLDATFDGDGKLSTDFGNRSDRAFDAAIQADGKILVAGSDGSDFVLARYIGVAPADNSVSESTLWTDPVRMTWASPGT